MLPIETHQKLSCILDYAKPFLWIWLLISIVLIFGGDKLFGQGWSDRGEIFFVLYLIFWAILVVVDKPEKCSFGHTDIGFYYGHWSCRTCYRNRQRRKISPTETHRRDAVKSTDFPL